MEKSIGGQMPPAAWTHHGPYVHIYSQTWAARHATLTKANNNAVSRKGDGIRDWSKTDAKTPRTTIPKPHR